MGQSQSKGPDPLMGGDEPARIFGKELSEAERRELLLKAYNHVKESLERFRRPDGKKDAPARTCRDLHVAHPELPSGEYWIDPNDGDPRDAILAHCDMDRRATCVFPQPKRSPEVTYNGDEQEVWLGDVPGGIKLTYKSDSNQLGFLQLLSTAAQQNLTYHCKNSVAYHDAAKNTYRKAVKFLAYNDAEITARGNQRFRYDVLEDGCKHRKNEWSKTVMTYRTDKAIRLPVLDMAVKDVGKEGQSFWLEIGMVCFS